MSGVDPLYIDHFFVDPLFIDPLFDERGCQGDISRTCLRESGSLSIALSPGRRWFSDGTYIVTRGAQSFLQNQSEFEDTAGIR